MSLVACIVVLMLTLDLFASERESIDYRDIETGWVIPDEDWGEQPLIVKLADGRWFCVLTTGQGKEGSSSQHIVYTISSDKGKTWTALRDIEPADGPEASCACPYIVPSGPAKERIYVFYVFNADNVREIKKMDGRPLRRVDLLGEYAFRYTDDYGETWSERHYLPYRKTSVDLRNSSRGKVNMFWGNDKPMLDNGTLFFAFSKIGGWGGRYSISHTEGWMWRCENILEEADVSKLKWTMLPDGDEGLKAPAGIISEEPMSTVLSDGSLYCVTRTVQGHPAEYYSRDRGHTWTKSAYMKYTIDGRNIAHPRANCPVWKLSNGKYLFWFHNHTGNPRNTFSDRNPAWVAGGVEVDGPDGRILKWSEPEILLYTDPRLRHVGMTYPDIVEDHGEVYVSETQESIARVHKIDKDLLEGMWAQLDGKGEETRNGLALTLNANVAKAESVDMPRLPDLTEANTGFSVDIRLNLKDMASGQVILDSRDDKGKGIALMVEKDGALKLHFSDGENKAGVWTSDPGLLKAGQTHHVTTIVDGGPSIISFVVDGRLCDGGESRQFGWGRFDPKVSDVNGSDKLRLSPSFTGKILSLRIYDRCLRTSEAAMNHQAGVKHQH